MRANTSPPFKAHDSPVAVFFATRVALILLPWAKRSGISPNALTVTSLLLSAIAAFLIASGRGAIAAGMLIALGFVFDCLDGTLARASGRTSDFGCWLDSLTDFVKIHLLVIGLGIASTRVAAPSIAIALCAVALLGYSLCELHQQIARQLPQRGDEEYAATSAPWRGRVRCFGQRVDLAFAIGEVLATIAFSASLGRPEIGLAILAVATPIQFVSYSVRFWRRRYVRPRAS